MLAQEAGGGPRSIITITSVNAAMAAPDRSEYCVSKAGLAMWSQCLALRLADHGIGVFDVRPGIIKTDMTEKVADKYDPLIEAGRVPAKRWGTGGDIGQVVCAMAKGEFAFATGSVVNVDGGLSIARL